MLELSHLNIGISDGGRGVEPILTDIELTVEAGQAVGLVGETGTGKSLLVQTIGGLVDHPIVAEGAIRLDGRDLLAMELDERRKILGRELAILMGGGRSRLNPLERVGNQIARVALDHDESLDRKDAYDRAVELIRRVGIPDPEIRAQSYPHELSGGMCQRVVIAMSLVNRPRFLVTDDPTTGLDVTVARQVLDDFNSLIEDSGLGLLIATGDLGIVAQYCDRVAVLSGGRLTENADVETFFENPEHEYSKRLLEVTELDRARAAGDKGGGNGSGE